MKDHNLKDIFSQSAYSLELSEKMTSCFHNKKLICPTCKKEVHDPVDKELVSQGEECTGCEHVRGSILNDQKSESDLEHDQEAEDEKLEFLRDSLREDGINDSEY